MARYIYDKTNHVEIPITGDPDPTNFVGTLQQWASLTQAEKNLYDSVDLTDDYNDVTEDINDIKTDIGTLSSLTTTNKSSIVSAINEVNAKPTGSNAEVYIAGVEETNTASQAYTVGQYFIYNNILYEAIASIAQGDTLTVGTNMSATTVGSQLSSIQSNLKASNITAGVTDVPFRFGCDDDGNFGYIINEGGADTVIPFKSGGDIEYYARVWTQSTGGNDAAIYITEYLKTPYGIYQPQNKAYHHYSNNPSYSGILITTGYDRSLNLKWSCGKRMPLSVNGGEPTSSGLSWSYSTAVDYTLTLLPE